MNYSKFIYFQNQPYNVFRFEGNEDILILQPAYNKYLRIIILCDLRSYSIICSFETYFEIKIILNDKIIFSNQIDAKNSDLFDFKSYFI